MHCARTPDGGIEWRMFLSVVFEKFVKKSPVSVMARATMEHALSAEALDAMFAKTAVSQYARDLLFSCVVDLLGVVVSKVQPSVHAALQAVVDTLPVSVTAFYDKLNGTEPVVTAALVTHTGARLAPVIAATGGQLPALLPGYRVRIIDGNHLAATERRLEVLRGSVAGPLPGHALVVLDPSLMLATHMIPCEDAHAQERSLSSSILALVAANDVWVADRNFCTRCLLFGIAARFAFFVIRHHANLTLTPITALRLCGRTDTGQVYEQLVTICDDAGELLTIRRVLLRLNKPTRDGDTEMSILTNLPEEAAAAVVVANLYAKRWTLETLFQSLTQMLEAEINTLGYPRAALLGFAIGLATYNILSTIQASLRGAFGIEKVNTEVSGFYIANEIRGTAMGMSIAIEDVAWESFRTMNSSVFAHLLVRWAAGADLRKFKRHVRGPKTAVPKRTRFADKTHVSTARLLAAAKEKRSP